MAASESILAPLFKRPTAADAAMWASDPHDADKRARGMNILANESFGGAEAYLGLYRQRLNDEDIAVRAVACRSLALHGSAEDALRIIPLTTSPDIQVRLEATRALQRLHNKAAITPLIERRDIDKEPEAEIRAEAASALGQYAEGAVLQALIASLADPSLLVNKNAHDSLRTLTGNDDLPAELKPWQQWVAQTATPFANRRAYVYPIFWREKRWLDYVPFMPPVPNEIASTPTGFSMEEIGQQRPAPSPSPPKAAPPSPEPAATGDQGWQQGRRLAHP